jgi:hypothetical protein
VGELKLVIKRYLRGFFVPDAIAAVPITIISSYLVSNLGISAKLAKLPRLVVIFKMLRVVKLAKLLKSVVFIQVLIEKLTGGLSNTRLLQTFFLVTLVTHLMACIWYILSDL